MILALAVLFMVCLLGFAAWFPTAAAVIWILLLETSPDAWLGSLIGAHETIIGVMKAAGLVLAVLIGVRFGLKGDRANPAFAFVAMFCTGVMHGLLPGLNLLASLRSLFGSAAPFAFGFVRLPAHLCQAVTWAVILGPAVTVAFGAVLSAAGVYPLFVVFQGAMELGGSGTSPFLAGFTLIAIYAGLLEFLRGGKGAATLLVNLPILVLTGARAPLALTALLVTGTLIARRRLLLCAALGAAVCLALVFAGSLDFIRVVNLVHLGEASDLSNRDLVWPFFWRAFLASPWVGWGVGAGKEVLPAGSGITGLIGTNAAHDEYLRIGAEGGLIGLALLVGMLAAWLARGTQHLPPGERRLMVAVSCAFAIHSATDNTLIATTSSVFFLWVSTVFASGAEATKAPA